MSRFKGIKRGAKFEAWSYGKMVAIGSRQPAGGIPGDCYREYPELNGDTLEDIQALFTYAYVSCFLFVLWLLLIRASFRTRIL